jgi:hypothetical protein
MKTIHANGMGRAKELEKFDADFKELLEKVRLELALDTFCKDGGNPTDADVYQVELKTFSDKKAVGVIHLSFIERLRPNGAAKKLENHHHVRYGFELNRSNGELQLGKGFLRT